MSGAPKEMERTPSADQATSQERRVSIVPATAARPPTVAVVIIYNTHGTHEAFGLVGPAAVLSVKAPRQCGFGLGDHPMKDCCRRLDRIDHVDRFPGINDRGVEIPHRSRRGITSALGMHFCFQHLFSVVPFSPERVSERAAGIVGR